MRKIWLIVFVMCSQVLLSAPFQQSYNDAPLYIVLQDIETHFGYSFLYRPHDIAEAPTITATFSSTDYASILRKVLGEKLTFTLRKNIIIITPAPPKPKKEAAPIVSVVKVRTTIEEPKSTSIETHKKEDTLKRESIFIPTKVAPLEVKPIFAPLPLLRPYSLTAFSPIDTVRIAHIAASLSTHNTLPKKHTSLSFRHSFLTTLSGGYGSGFQANASLQYAFFFHDNWGVSAGLDFTYDALFAQPSFPQDGRLGIPIAAHTIWQLSPTWGLHASAGVTASFLVYFAPSGVSVTNKSVDEIAFLTLHATHPIGEKSTMLLGVYGNLSATSLTPWSVGIQLGLLVGK